MPRIDYARIKQDTIDSLNRYVNLRIPTGGFLEAVLSNNLSEAFGRADEENCAALFHIAAYIYNELPSNCWGSPESVKQWLAGRKETVRA